MHIELKTLKEGEDFPGDFWNYKINPITGYRVELSTRHSNNKGDERKYSLKPQSTNGS
tara:strand:+ start:2052 stop:2225 length:174 start_codon:yes stop_codon:yes gene_type:complete